jgi:hypothetical protein
MKFLMFVLFATYSWQATAAQPVPDCQANAGVLAVNNAEVIQWKQTTQNQFHSRAHVLGTLTKVFADHSGHHHMEVKIGNGAGDDVEVIYNEAFGAMPALAPGMTVEACGDYITSNAPSGQYPASPDGAIVHWVHKSNNANHPSGYVVIDGVVCGQNAAGAGPKPGGHHGHP